MAANNLQMIGNAALLDLPEKVAFLSSRRISTADVLKCYEWAEKIRDTETCVISGFQSSTAAGWSKAEGVR